MFYSLFMFLCGKSLQMGEVSRFNGKIKITSWSLPTFPKPVSLYILTYMYTSLNDISYPLFHRSPPGPPSENKN